MAAVTDLPFRTVCEELGVGLTITEFLSADALADGAKKTTGKLTPSLDGRRFGVQIFGREPETMARGRADGGRDRRLARRHQHGLPGQARGRGRVRLGADARARARAGARARGVARGARATSRSRSSTAPAGTSATCNAPEFACAMVEAGAAMITVHGRTRTQGFSGKSDPRHHRQRARRAAAHIPVVGNGDVIDVDDYFRMREETGCDAVMIGRGALGNPWLFRALGATRAARRSGAPTLDERHARVPPPRRSDRRARAAEAHVHELRKAVAWYAQGPARLQRARARVLDVLDPIECARSRSSFSRRWIEREQRASREILSR